MESVCFEDGTILHIEDIALAKLLKYVQRSGSSKEAGGVLIGKQIQDCQHAASRAGTYGRYDFPPAPQSDQCRNDTGFIEWRNKYDFSAAPHLERYTARNTRIHAKNALPTIYYDAAKTQCTSGFLQYLINKKSFPSMKR